jgi:uncharacterized membrane protein
VLVIANGARAVLVIPAGWYVWHGHESAGFILVALGVVGLNRFVLAGLAASTPHVAEQPRLVTANSLGSTAGSVTYAVALAGSGGIVRAIGPGYHAYASVAAFALLAYGWSALLTQVSFGPRTLGPDESERPGVAAALAETARGLASAVGHLRQRPVAAQVIAVQAANRGLYGVLALMTLLLYRNYFYAGSPRASVAGLLPIAAAAAVGSLIAALVTPAASRRLGWQTWAVLLVSSLAVGVPALCLPLRPGLFVAGALLVSVVAQGIKIVSDTALQVQCDDDFRGRVFSLNDTVYNLLFVAGIYVGSQVMPATGRAPRTVIVLGLGYALTAIWYASVSRRTRPAVA